MQPKSGTSADLSASGAAIPYSPGGHVGFNGRTRNSVNYRMEVLLCEKLAGDPTFTPNDLIPVLSDITPEAWMKLKRQKIAA